MGDNEDTNLAEVDNGIVNKLAHGKNSTDSGYRC